MTLTYPGRICSRAGRTQVPRVLLVQEWLAQHLDAPASPSTTEDLLLPHCTERTTARPACGWQAVFAACGQRCDPASGCCGMAGTYGHEAEHRAMSERIYGLSWANHVAEQGKDGRLLATAIPAGSQAALIDGVKLLHPVQALNFLFSRERMASRSIRAG